MKKNLFLVCLLFISTFLSAQKAQRFYQEDNTVRLMSYNIRSGKGLDDVRDLDRTAAVINSINPAVIALQEVDSVTGRVNNRDIIAELGQKTAMYTVYGAAINYSGGKYGIGVMSKEKPLSHVNVPLPGREEERTVLAVEFADYYVLCTHWSLTAEDRLSSIDIINDLVEKFDKPAFLIGDLNASPESDSLERLKKRWTVLNNTKQATFPANDPVDHIDYILGYKGNGQKYTVIQTQVINEPVVSDHRPLFADIRLPQDNDKVMRTAPYLQNPATDAMTVMWHTTVPCRSWVEYGTDKNNFTRARDMIEGMMAANNTTNRIRIENLEPNTTYYYRVVSQEITSYRPYHKVFGDTIYSDINTFTTMNPQTDDYKIVIYNDLHRNHALLKKFSSLFKDDSVDLVVYNGDCLDDVNNEAEALYTIDSFSQNMNGANVPSIFLRGNHEPRGAYATFLWDLFDKMGGGTSYTAFSMGDTRFMLLDCGEDKPDDHWVYYDMNDFSQYRLDQLDFIREELKTKEFKKAKKRVLIHHIPIFGEGMKKYPHVCKELWEADLAKGKFDVALNAHTHKYEFLEKGADGNTYPVVIGGGNNEKSATVAVLEKKGKSLTLEVMNVKGDSLLKLDL